MTINARADIASNMGKPKQPQAKAALLRCSDGGIERQAMATYPMAPRDVAWYHNDGPANQAIMTGVLLTSQALDFDKVRAVYRDRLLGFKRFRQRVVDLGVALATPHWQDMPQFDIDQHLHHIALAAPHDQVALRALVSDLASTPLDHAQPLWQVHVVDDVDGGSALIMRCHHCIADGTAMMTVIGKLFDSTPAPLHPQPPSVAGPADAAASASHLRAPALDVIDRGEGRATAVTHTVVDVLTHPGRLLEQAAVVVGGAAMLVSELLKTDDPQSPLKGDFALQKRVAWSEPVALKDIKAVGARYHARVNDVLVAAVTGALRSYLKGRGLDVNHSTLRAMVPVDLRPPERAGQLGNEFGLVILELAVAKASPVQRLALTKTRMDELKHSPEPVATRILMEILGHGPKALEDFANMLFGRKASLVVTNVVGPREVLYLAGVPIDRMMAWAPHPGRELGMAISILSYRGTVSVTVIGDALLVPDPQAIAEQFQQEFKSLLRTAKAQTSQSPTKRVQAKPVTARSRRP